MSMESRIRRRNVVTWALYDFANNAFPTLIITFVYATYFERVITPEGETSQWALAMAIGAVLIALLSPVLGTMADATGKRKQFLLVSTLMCIGFTWLLYFPRAGDVWFALGLVVVANVAFEICNVFYNGLLPEIAEKKHTGKISGIGWGVSYIGGLLCLLAVLVLFIQPENGFMGMVPSELKVPSMTWFVGGWYLVFALPLFLFLKLPGDAVVGTMPDTKRSVPKLIRQSFSELFHTLKLIRKDFPQIFRLLVARLFYNDGLVTIFAFGGIYATTVFGFGPEEVLVFGIVINIAAGIGAIGFGFLEDKIGSRTTIIGSLIGFIGVSFLAVFAPSREWFWVAAVLVGILSGPNQSASRSLMAKFVPDKRENEFFGLFAFSGKATAFLSPLAWQFFLNISGNERVAMSSVLIFFTLGLFLVFKVNEKAGITDSQAKLK